MIRGVVNNRLEGMIRFEVRGPFGVKLDVDVVVDSGYTGTLILPPKIIAALDLTLSYASRGYLADGSACEMGVYAAEILWDGSWRPVMVSELNGQPLLGMALVEGHELRINVKVGGSVAIVPGSEDEGDYDDVMIV